MLIFIFCYFSYYFYIFDMDFILISLHIILGGSRMITRRTVYEAHGFKCNPAYNSFDKELSETEYSQLLSVLEKLKKANDDNTDSKLQSKLGTSYCY